MARDDKDNDQPLFPSSLFEYENRPKRDVAFIYIYFLSLLASLIGGIVAYSHRNGDYDKLTSSEHISKPSSCPSSPGRRLLQERPSSDEFDFTHFMMMAGVWIAVSVIGSAILGFIFVHLLKTRASAVIKAVIAVQVGSPLIFGIIIIAVGGLFPGMVLLTCAAIMAFCFYTWRDKFALIARLISISAQGLKDNPVLIWIVFGLQITLFLVTIPILFSMLVAQMNGELVYNSIRADSSSSQCVDAAGEQVPCCVWQMDAWVIPYITFAGVVLLWTTFLSFQVKVYSTAGTIAQWYFAPVTVQSFRGNAMRSLKHALGPSFGSLCLGSGILTLCDILRHATNRARRQNQGSIVACLLACIMACLASIIEYITKFATVQAAITGEAFFTAGQNVLGLLKRNLVSTVGVWWLPPMVLNSCALIISLMWGTIIGLTSFVTWHDPDQAVASGIALGIIAAVFTLIVLAFFTSLLLNILDAVFICFAMDREQQAYTKPLVHEVFSQIPNVTVGPIVQNPDGEVAYGAPAAELVEAPYEPPTQHDAGVARPAGASGLSQV